MLLIITKVSFFAKCRPLCFLKKIEFLGPRATVYDAVQNWLVRYETSRSGEKMPVSLQSFPVQDGGLDRLGAKTGRRFCHNRTGSDNTY